MEMVLFNVQVNECRLTLNVAKADLKHKVVKLLQYENYPN